jgi:hypothetical protein
MFHHALRVRLRAIASIFLVFGTVHAEDYKLYYLGGQSNMDGYGYTKDLSEGRQKPVEGVLIFHGNTAPDGDPQGGKGVWTTLQPGHGVGFKSDGAKNEYSDRFGSELSFGARLRELHPDSNIAIVKYSRGGTSIDSRAAGSHGCWDPDFEGGEGEGQGINQYDHCLATLRNALQNCDIDRDGETDTLEPAGIVWMQGESDAIYTEEIANAYKANLTRLMSLLRAALRVDDLPVAIGRISDSGRITGKWMMEHYDIVRAAQKNFADSDGNAALVISTENYGFSDDWHYDSPAYLDLGEKFAETLAEVK